MARTAISSQESRLSHVFSFDQPFGWRYKNEGKQIYSHYFFVRLSG